MGMKKFSTSFPSASSPLGMSPIVSACLGMALLCTGCASQGLHGSADPVALVERLVEQESYDSDASVVVGAQSVPVTGAAIEDLARIHHAATRCQDYELALAASVTLIRVSDRDSVHLGWRLLGDTLEQCEPGLAVALAARRLELVSLLERECGFGLHDSASQIRRATVRRSYTSSVQSKEIFRASRWTVTSWGDDESGIQRAMLFALEANDLLAHAGASHTDQFALLQQVQECEDELCSGQATDINKSWSSTIAHGESRLRGALLRSAEAISRTAPSVSDDETNAPWVGGMR